MYEVWGGGTHTMGGGGGGGNTGHGTIYTPILWEDFLAKATKKTCIKHLPFTPPTVSLFATECCFFQLFTHQKTKTGCCCSFSWEIWCRKTNISISPKTGRHFEVDGFPWRGTLLSTPPCSTMIFHHDSHGFLLLGERHGVVLHSVHGTKPSASSLASRTSRTLGWGGTKNPRNVAWEIGGSEAFVAVVFFCFP